METQELNEIAQALRAATRATSSAAASVPSALRTYREAHGLTQDALGKQLGVSQATIARVECGIRPPSRKLVYAIAKLTESTSK